MNGGVLLIDKPKGPTSHDVVAKVRRVLKTKRVGHAGTLDPMASGLLFLCVDDATRLLEYVSGSDKTYTGEVTFGVGTDTDDAEGEVVEVLSVDGLDEAQILDAVTKLTGRIEQTVPIYSAVHVGGRRAYELARLGQSVEMPSKSVIVQLFEIQMFSRSKDVLKASFTVQCSKGTYIRALCRDLGRMLGVPAHMSELRRMAIGATSVEAAVSLEQLETVLNPRALCSSPISYFDDYPYIDIGRIDVERLASGQRIHIHPSSIVSEQVSEAKHSDVVMVRHGGELAVVAKRIDDLNDTILKPMKVFWKKG